MRVDLGDGVTVEVTPGSQRASILLAMGHPLVDDQGDELDVAGLREQIDALNADRPDDDQLSKGGRKADLAARIAEAAAQPTPAEAPPSR